MTISPTTPDGDAAGAGVLDGYEPGGADELHDAAGAVRDHWRRVSASLADLGLDGLRQRRQESDRLLDEDGVTYNVLPRGAAARAERATSSRGRRWALDPVPAVLPSDEWSRIERAVIQRTELLNLVLTDLYGPRDLLRTKVLPPELVYADPGYVRPWRDIRIAGPVQLVTAGFDIARGADGQHVVLADRVQAPSGFGYALENRQVVSRVFPSLYRDSEVHRLAPFFRTLRAALQAAAPPGTDDPRIVVLSPGPHSETAFEHAFLARYLGYSLVEGADLTVHGGRVWLRSLGHLEPVDVILRRVDPWYCDPVELLPDSRLGVPGLVDACRRGTVSVINPLGAAVVENPALLAYLPRLASELFGHDLHLPSVPSWWCGDEASRREVLARFDRDGELVFKQLTPAGSPVVVRRPPIHVWRLSTDERRELRARVEAEPRRWVAQEWVELATSPTLVGGAVEPRRAVLRTYTAARGDSYAAMPGGLTRVAARDDSLTISNQAGAISKDTWVLASEPERLTGFWLQAGPAVTAIAPEGSMSSRAAENLFWLGRYAERAEGLVRLLRAVGDRRNDFQHTVTPAGKACFDLLLGALTDVTGTWPGFVTGDSDLLDDPGEELRSLVVDEQRPGTLAYDARRLLDAAYAVRDQLSNDTWLVIGSLEHDLLGPAVGTYPRGVGSSTLSRVLQSLLALAGLQGESMVRDPGWRFMDAGRRVERALNLVDLLRATVTSEHGTATDSLVFESVLIAAESIITYRRRYRSHAQLETLLDLLVLDAGNPRSLIYQAERLCSAVAELPDASSHAGSGRMSPAERTSLELLTAVRLVDSMALAHADPDGAPEAEGPRPELCAFLDRTGTLLRSIATEISRAHFTPLQPQRSLLVPPDQADVESAVLV